MTSLLSNPVIRDAVVPLSVEQYRRMGESGIIDEKTELIDGVILQKMIKSPLHTLAVKRLLEALRPNLPAGFELRKEEPLGLMRSEPEPDISIVAEDSYDPRKDHPTTAALVIEVAISSEAIDRAKTSIYATAGIPEYWLVLPAKKSVERFTEPSGHAYQVHEMFGFDRRIQLASPLNLAVDFRVLESLS
jgi:Uma2 family endonuclease